MVRTVLAPAVVSFAASTAAIPLLIRIANKFGVMDRPGLPLKTHRAPIPYLGGVAVFLGILAASVFYPGTVPSELWGLLLGASVMHLVGLADDFRPLSPYPKLLFQFLAATLAILGGVHISITALPPMVNYFLTYLWMMAITNAFNIIDIHDGLCSGTAAIVSFGLLLVSLFTTLYDKTFVTVLSAAVLGGSLAFFRVNRPPARMFLGDAGSMTLGFLLAGLAIGESYTPDHLVGLLVPVLLFLVPVYDLIFVVIVRLMKGLSPIRGSPDHVAIRLRHLGWSDAQVLASLLAVSAVSAVLSPGVVFLPFPYALFIAACALAGAVGLGAILAGIRKT